VSREHLDHVLGLFPAHHPLVDEDAGEPLADGLVDEHGSDRRIDAAREAEDRLVGQPHLFADATHLLFDDRSRSPVRRAVAGLVEEVLEDVDPARRVHDLGVELDGVEPALAVLNGGDGRAVGGREGAEPLGGGRDRVAVTHPTLLLAGEAVEEQAVARHAQGRLAELADARLRHRPTQLQSHELGAVADAEDRDAEVVQTGVGTRRPVDVDAHGAAAEDQPLGPAGSDLLDGEVVRDELRVDAALAHPSGDELTILRPEVEDEDGVEAAVLFRR